MAYPGSRTAFSTTIRRLVAVALAPAACGGSTLIVSTNDAGGDATQVGSHPVVGDDSSPLPNTPDAAVVPAADGGEDADAGNVICPCGPARGCYTCQDTFDGGAGACATQRVSGTTCSGMELLFPCGLPAPVVTDAAYVNPCDPYCTPGFLSCSVVTNDGGTYTPIATLEAGAFSPDSGGSPTLVSCVAINCTGRLPESLVGEASDCATTAGEALAQAAYLEAAAVRAFLDLATQLDALGAPATLVRRARRAARDEVRHARAMSALARARGCSVREPVAAPSAVTDPFAIALLNAREGCVRETWGAACAVVQSHRAAEPALRRVMTAIARDEIAHAALSRDIAAWLEPRLTPAQREAVNAERRRAVFELEAELRDDRPSAAGDDMRATLGLPSRREARALFASMRVEVWSEAA